MNLLKLNAIGAVVLAGALSFYACNPKSSEKSSEEAVAQPADTGLSISTATATVEGKEAQVYTLKNANGVEVDISNYGGVITRLVVPDKAGKLENVVLHYQDLEGYSTSTNYFGSTVGRYANRIAKGKFELDGEAYTLATKIGRAHV